MYYLTNYINYGYIFFRLWNLSEVAAIQMSESSEYISSY